MDKDVGGARAPNIEPSDVTEGSGTKCSVRASTRHEAFCDIADAIPEMAITEKQRDFVRAAFRAAVMFAARREFSRDETPGDTVSADGTYSLYESSLNNPLTSADTGVSGAE